MVTENELVARIESGDGISDSNSSPAIEKDLRDDVESFIQQQMEEFPEDTQPITPIAVEDDETPVQSFIDATSVDEPSNNISPQQKATTSNYAALALIGLGKAKQENYTDIVDNVSARIDQKEEQSIRDIIEIDQKEAQRSQREEFIKDWLNDPNITNSPERVEEIAALLIQQGNLEAFKNDHALEEAGISYLQDLRIKDPVQAHVLARQLNQDDDVLVKLEEFQTKTAIWQRELDRFRTADEETGVTETVVNFLGSFIPAREMFTRGNVFLSDMLDERQELLELPLEEFKQRLPEFMQSIRDRSSILGENEMLALQAAEQTLTASEADLRLDVLFNAIDIAEIASIGGALGLKGAQQLAYAGAKLTNSLKFGGNTKQASEAVAQGIERMVQEDLTRPSHILSNKETIDEILPSAISGDSIKPANDISLSAQAVKMLEVNTKAMESLKETVTTGRLTGEELELAIEKTKSSLTSELGGRNPIDFKPVLNENRTILNDTDAMDVFFGKKDGTGFASKSSAEAAKKRWRLPKDTPVVKGVDGTYTIKQRFPLREVNAIKAHELSDINVESVVGRFLKSGANVSDRIRQAGLEATLTNDKLVKEVMMPLEKNLRKLNKNDRAALEVALMASDEASEWIPASKLKQQYGLSDKAIAGYQTMRTINDIDYSVRNASAYKKLSLQGYHTLSYVNELTGFKTKVNRGKVVNPNDFDLNNHTLYVGETDEFFGKKTLTQDKLNQLVEGGQIIEVSGDVLKINTGDPIRYMLLPKDRGYLRPLDPVQIPYRAGGHRVYEGKWFVKQAVVGFRADGERFIQNPQAHIVAKSKREAAEWASLMEAARQSYQSYKKGDIGLDEVMEAISHTSL